MLAALPLLNYLDRPVFEAERVAITAWAEGNIYMAYFPQPTIIALS